jgi:hypothetical protein
MNNYSKRTKITIWVVVTVLISVILSIIFNRDLGDYKDWIFVIPNVITIELIVHWLFTQHLWKCKILYPWLVPFPDFTGTWVGELHSSYINPKTNIRDKPRRCMLVIKHEYSTIHMIFVTDESRSYSFSEEIIFDSSKMIKQLTYCYANEPKLLLTNNNPNHKGTVVLSLIDTDRFEGVYFTDRETKGEIYLDFIGKKLLDKFPEDLKDEKYEKRL